MATTQRASAEGHPASALDARRPAPSVYAGLSPYGAWSTNSLATTLDLLERTSTPEGRRRAEPQARAEPAAPTSARTGSLTPSRGVQWATGLGALVGCGLPCAAGMAFLVPVPSFINPSGQPALAYAAPLLGAGLTLGLGMGMVLGKQLGEACRRQRRRTVV